MFVPNVIRDGRVYSIWRVFPQKKFSLTREGCSKNKEGSSIRRGLSRMCKKEKGRPFIL
jgi:hypothetical protein